MQPIPRHNRIDRKSLRSRSSTFMSFIRETRGISERWLHSNGLHRPPDLEEKSEFPINIHPADNRRVKKWGERGRHVATITRARRSMDAKGGCSGGSVPALIVLLGHPVICCLSRCIKVRVDVS